MWQNKIKFILNIQTTQDDKMNILVQLFWICLAVFESDFEHEFLLALRLLDKVLNKLPLDRPGRCLEQILRKHA
jgi:hypothetical protein